MSFYYTNMKKLGFSEAPGFDTLHPKVQDVFSFIGRNYIQRTK